MTDTSAGAARDSSSPSRDRTLEYVGRSMPRFEDARLVTGSGSFVGDVQDDEMTHGAVLRSVWAHARILTIDVAAARALDGVLACFTAADLDAAGLGGIPWEVCPPPFQNRARFQGDPDVSPPQPLLARDRVRYVGEPIAFVVATTSASALNAAEAIVVEVEDLAPVTETHVAVGAGAPQLHDHAAGNVLFTHEVGNRGAVDAAFERAAHLVRLSSHAPRLAAAPIEPRGYVGRYCGETDRYILDAAAGKPHPVRDTLARAILHVEPGSIQVRARDIGGGFGAKNVVHAEQALVLWAARVIGKPVRWIADRSESFLSDMQGRDHRIDASIALDADAHILAIRYESSVALGAWLAPRGVIPCLSGLKVLTGAYRIEAAHGLVRAVHTNTVPTSPYRGAGVPETTFVLERLVDIAARRLRLDPAEVRRRNVLRPDALPWTSPTGASYHSVNYPALLESALELSGWANRRERGPGSTKLRGFGLSLSMEAYGVAFDEQAEIHVTSRGVEVRIGTMSAGQSHETTYRQIAADALDLEPGMISILQGDTDRIARGNGTGASRSITTGGSAVLRAAEKLVQEGVRAAAGLLQCRPGEVTYSAGRFDRRGSEAPAGISLGGLAEASPNGVFTAFASFRPEAFNFPGGCHVAEVEVDPETGEIDVVAYRAVQDSGVAINPQVVAGQLHGGLAQGIGAALMEALCWDPDTGQALTTSFLDYDVPRAMDLPSFDIALAGVPCASNPLGAKAVGEAGPVAAPPAVVNAVIDALAHLGIEHLEMPLTPPRVWRAIAQQTPASRQSTMKSNADPAGA